MLLDLDSFYAQCEENVNPSLKGKPVVVCVYSGRTHDSGAVSTANYAARKYGVKAGIPIVRAKKILESLDAAFVPMNHPLYEQVSERIMETLRTQADAFEQTSIDEAFLDVSERADHSFVSAKDAALEIKKQLATQENVTASIGIGPNKLVAKIASDQSKPDGLTIVKTEQATEFLAPLSANRIPGVGKKAEEKLAQLNVFTISDLSNLSPATLVDAFGKSLGAYLYRAARGEDDEPVRERGPPTQFSRIATLKQITRDAEDTYQLLAELAKSVSDKLKEQEMSCKSVAIIAILNDLSIHSRSRTLEPPTSEVNKIEIAAKQLTQEFLKANPEATLRRLGIKASGLSKEAGQTNMSKFLGAQ